MILEPHCECLLVVLESLRSSLNVWKSKSEQVNSYHSGERGFMMIKQDCSFPGELVKGGGQLLAQVIGLLKAVQIVSGALLAYFFERSGHKARGSMKRTNSLSSQLDLILYMSVSSHEDVYMSCFH